jgi:hypothetical protein
MRSLIRPIRPVAPVLSHLAKLENMEWQRELDSRKQINPLPLQPHWAAAAARRNAC